MAIADQIKTLIKSFADSDDTRFYATAMQIAASEARSGHQALAEELKKLIESSKLKTSQKATLGVVKTFSLNPTQKELNDLLELTQPHEKLKDLVLIPDLLKKLKRVLDEQRKSDILQKNNLFPRKKLLFVGPPGCGKTLSAKVIASELGLPLCIIRLDGLISRYMGESITKLRLIFDSMYQLRAVYFFDEFDSIGTTRNQANEVGEIKRVLNAFLLNIEKDSSNSLVIAATNLPEALDQALFRRFDDIIQYPLPLVEEIKKLYSKELSGFKPAKGFDLDRIASASISLSYADIHRICQDMVKETLIYGTEDLSENSLLAQINERKLTF